MQDSADDILRVLETDESRTDLNEMDPTSPVQGIQLTDEAGTDIGVMDPSLLEAGEKLIGTITGLGSEVPTEAAEAAIFDRIAAPSSTSNGHMSDMTLMEYTTFVSKVNVVRNSSLIQMSTAELVEAFETYGGNSRELPTLYRFVCKNSGNGCGYTSVGHGLLKFHEVHCKYVDEYVDMVPVSKKPFPCGQCSAEYDSKDSLNHHIREKHTEWVPRTCKTPRESCDPEQIFETLKDWNRHVRENHKDITKSNYRPSPCPVPDCTYTKVRPTISAMKNHLMNIHGLTEKTAGDYWPRARKRTPAPSQLVCPIEGCTSKKDPWSHRSDFERHLKQVHKLSGVELESLIP